MSKHQMRLAVFAIAAALCAGPAWADDDDDSSDDETCYTFEEVNVPDGDGGELYTSWFGINNREILVGNYCIESDCTVSSNGYAVGPAIHDRKKGTFSSFTVPGAYNWIGSVAVNDKGEMAGEALVAATVGDTVTSFLSGDGFVRDRTGKVTVLAPPLSGLTFWGISDINNRGDMVGFYEDSSGRIRGFIRNKKGSYSLYDAGSGDTYLSAINDDGTLAGDHRVGSDRDGFVDEGDGPEFFDAPGGTRTSATGINNDDDVVGVSAPATGWERTGFVRDDDDNYTALAFPGAARTTMIGINDRGTLVGTFDWFSFGAIADPVDCDDDDSSDDDDDSDD